jgi:hypothetical protein
MKLIQNRSDKGAETDNSGNRTRVVEITSKTPPPGPGIDA